MISKADYVELGLACASVCEALNRGIHGRQADQLSQSVLEAIEKLTMWVTTEGMPGDFLTKPSIFNQDDYRDPEARNRTK